MTKATGTIKDHLEVGKVEMVPDMLVAESMTADQQIRAKALECACRLYADHPREVGIDPEDFLERFERVFWADVDRFYNYIREGK